MRDSHLLTFLLVLLLTAPLSAQEHPSDAVPQRGTFSGRFLYVGQPPKPTPSSLEKVQLGTPMVRDNVGRVSGVELSYRNYLRAGIRPRTVDDSLLVGKDGGLANVVVYVTSPDVPAPAVDPEAKPHVLQIKDGQIAPRVVALVAGSTLEVENSDAIDFGFHLQSPHNEVNWMVAANSTRRDVLANSDKFPTKFRSDHQSWATGVLFVHRNPYFAISAPDGTFSIPNLPPGKWEFCAWHERVGYLKNWPKGRFQFEIEPGDNDLGDVKLPAEMFEGR